MNIFHLIFLFVFYILCFHYVHSHGKEHSKVLLISFDGFRHNYFDNADTLGFNLTNFNKLFKIGFKAQYMKNLFLTVTFPNHLSIITGCYQETHGIIDNHFFDPVYNETFQYTNVYQSLQSKWFNNSEPIWATNIINGYKSGVFYWPGYLAPFKNILPTYTFGIYRGGIPLNYKIDRVLDWLKNDDVTLGVMYHSEPDSIGHKFGPNSKKVFEQLKELDNSIGYLMEKIDQYKLKSSLNVIIVSDHGMTSISNQKRIIMDNYVDPSLYHSYYNQTSTFWAFWPRAGTNVTALFSLLKKVPHVTVMYKEEIPIRWHYRQNRRVAPIVVLAHEGWVMVHKESDAILLKGIHGYSKNFSDMYGIFVAWGPDIATINRTDIVVRSIDVFPLIGEILKYKHMPDINGSLSNIRWLLNNKINEVGLFTSLIIICVLSLVTVLSACIVISCAHYNANTLRVQKVGNTYVLKSGNLVRKWRDKHQNLGRDSNSNSYRYKIFLKNKSKTSESDAAFLLESHDEDEILGDITSGT